MPTKETSLAQPSRSIPPVSRPAQPLRNPSGATSTSTRSAAHYRQPPPHQLNSPHHHHHPPPSPSHPHLHPSAAQVPSNLTNSHSNPSAHRHPLSYGDHHQLLPQNQKKSIAPRSHKHAPIEISSKKPVTRKRTVVEVPKVERRDPRFDSLSGAVNEDLHERSFGFLKEQQQMEIDRLRQTLQQAKKKSQLNPTQLQALEEQLRREENREVQRQKMEWEKQALRKWKAEENAKRKEGKGAFYLKRKAQKEIILTDRYNHLSQNKSKLHKSIEKKRKKVDGKEKKSMPFKRQRPSD